MKIIKSPKIYLISYPTLRIRNFLQFMEDEGIDRYTYDAVSDGELLPELAGKLCYMSFNNLKGRRNLEYLHHIKELSHGSTYEHANYGFIFTGISRSVSHELVRHRAGMAYSQMSQRYVDESEANYILPPEIEENTQEYKEWLESIEFSHNKYVKLVEILNNKLQYIQDKTLRRKMARQAARSVLPNATETKIFVTGNVRAIRNFLELRGSEYADKEINNLALQLLEIMQKEAPNLFNDYRVENRNIITPYRKI